MALVDAIWLTEADVVALLNLPESITVLESALRWEAQGGAHAMAKTHVAWDGGNTLHALGATLPQSGFAGTKTWAHTRSGAAPLLVLFDSGSGALRAVIEAFALGQLRTAGISAVATRWLALPDAGEMAMIGTGKQALAQVAAVAAVRRLRRVRVFSPTAEHRVRFAQRVRDEIQLEVSVADGVAAAVESSPIITLATRATTPFLSAAMVDRGSHINAVGAITPERAEVEQSLFPRCSRVVADSVAAAKHLSRELMDAYSTSARWDEVTPLSAVVSTGHGRPANADLTLFKAMGTGLRSRQSPRSRPPHPGAAAPGAAVAMSA
jgi:alanine dehydrogenase